MLADFISGGWLERHVRRARKHYAVRRAAFLEALGRELGTRAELLAGYASLAERDLAIGVRKLTEALDSLGEA